MGARYAHANGEHIQAATDKLKNRYQHTFKKNITQELHF